jgi:hypothetical protein
MPPSYPRSSGGTHTVSRNAPDQASPDGADKHDCSGECRNGKGEEQQRERQHRHKIVEIDFLADPERLRELDLTVLRDRWARVPWPTGFPSSPRGDPEGHTRFRR